MIAKAKATRGKQATKGRGRPPEIEGMEVVTVRLPGELVEAIDLVVKESGHVYRDRSQFIRQSVALAMQPGAALPPGFYRQPPPYEPKLTPDKARKVAAKVATLKKQFKITGKQPRPGKASKKP